MIEINKINSFEDFSNTSKNLGIEINNNQLGLFKQYYKILLEWNEKINLISRKYDQVIEKHFLDSILFLPEIENLCRCWSRPAPTANVLDVGSGGGFPAIPLSIIKPEWEFTLCESTKKKAIFLMHLTKELGIEDKVKIINGRVEALPHDKKFNFITARAITKLDELIKYSLSLLKKDGYLLAYKAKDIEDEIKDAENLIKKNNLKLKIFSKEINGVERKLVTIQL